MSRLKYMLCLLLMLISFSMLGQKNILKYSIKLFSDTTVTETIKIIVSYSSDMGTKEGYVKMKRNADRYSIQVFWKRAVDSVGFLTEDFLLDTSYSTSVETLISELKRDSKNSMPNKISDLTQWTWVFVVPNRMTMTSYDKRGIYLYHRLRYNSFLAL